MARKDSENSVLSTKVRFSSQRGPSGRNQTHLRFALLVGVALLANISAGCSSQDIGSLLREYGYLELRPPSTLVPPGTVIHVRNRDPLVVGIICNQKASLGEKLSLETSRSVTSDLTSKASRTFKLSADYLNLLKAEAKYKYINNIELHLSNVSLYEIPDFIVLENFGNRRESCQKAIERRLSQGEEVTMIKAVLMADVVYNVEFETAVGLELGAKEAIVRQLAGELGADAGTANSQLVKGNSLFWGVVDDISLANAKARLVGVAQRLLPVSDMVRFAQVYLERAGDAPPWGVPLFQAETVGQAILLDDTQKKREKEIWTQAPNIPTPTSASTKPCEGFPGFDRGCPGGGK